MGIEPFPITVVTTGTFVFSTTSRKISWAREITTPPPARNKGRFALFKEFDGTFELADVDICVGLVSADIYIFRIFSAAEFCHYVLWKVDKDRSRTAGAGNVKASLMIRPRSSRLRTVTPYLVMLLVIPTMSTS